MKRLEELGISPAPWKLCRDGEIVHGNGYSLTDGDGCFVLKSDARLIAAAPKLYSKAYEVAENLRVHLTMPTQTISMNRAEVEDMAKDLLFALAEAAGEVVVK